MYYLNETRDNLLSLLFNLGIDVCLSYGICFLSLIEDRPIRVEHHNELLLVELLFLKSS